MKLITKLENYIHVSEIMEESDDQFSEKVANIWELPPNKINQLDPFRLVK
jgi:hypothetical protein